HCESPHECNHGENHNCRSRPKDPCRTQLAVSLRLERCHHDRQKTLAGKNGQRVAAAVEEIFVECHRPAVRLVSRVGLVRLLNASAASRESAPLSMPRCCGWHDCVFLLRSVLAAKARDEKPRHALRVAKLSNELPNGGAKQADVVDLC